MSPLWFLSAVSLHIMSPGPGVEPATPPLGRPVTASALADVHGRGLPTAGINQASASIEAAVIPSPDQTTRPSDIVREVMDNWNFHEGLDLIFAAMTDGSRNAAYEHQQTNGATNFRLQIGGMPPLIIRQ